MRCAVALKFTIAKSGLKNQPQVQKIVATEDVLLNLRASTAYIGNKKNGVYHAIMVATDQTKFFAR